MRICTVPECGKKHKALDLCRQHWQAQYDKEYEKRNKEKISSRRKKYHLDNRESDLKRQKEYRINNLEKIQISKRKCYEAKREYYLAMANKWKVDNREKRLEILRRYAAKRHRQLELAAPKWANQTEIETIYRNCPEGKVVDHIVPLLGKNVCGLHLPCNFQYLTPEENSRKGNRHG